MSKARAAAPQDGCEPEITDAARRMNGCYRDLPLLADQQMLAENRDAEHSANIIILQRGYI